MSGALGSMSGPQGPPGVAASGAIPSGFVHMSTPRVINPDTFADVTGAVAQVTIGAEARLAAWAEVSWSAGPNVVCEFRLVIDGTVGDAVPHDSGGHSHNITVPVTLRSAALAAGLWDCKVQARKVSGAGDATVSHVDITAMALAVE